MKSAVIFALAGTSLAVPFGNAINAIYGAQVEARQATPSGAVPTGLPSGFPSGVPFPSGTGHHHHHHPTGVRPTGVRPSGTGAFALGAPGATGTGRPGHHHGHHSKSLAIDYELAPTAVAKYKVEERQAGSGSAALPSFTLANPSDAVPTASSVAALPTETGFPTGLPSGFPTGLPSGFPSGFPHPSGGFPHPTGGFPHHPSGGFPHPTGGFPHPTGAFPTTLATFTRGPKPTSTPTQESSTGTEAEKQSWAEWLEGVLGAAKSKAHNN